MSTTAVNELADLSNDDVKLLYEIVTAAENSSAPTYRAIFTAHEQVLAQHGIPKDTDQLYLRFLLRMGEDRTPKRNLFQKFEVLLAKLGINLAFDGDHAAHEDSASANGPEELESSPSIKHLQTQAFRPARRNSFDSTRNSNSNAQESLDQLRLLPTRPRSLDSAPQNATRPHPQPPLKSSFSQSHISTAQVAPKAQSAAHGTWIVRGDSEGRRRSSASYSSLVSKSTGTDLDGQARSEDSDQENESEPGQFDDLDESPTLLDALQAPILPENSRLPEALLEKHAGQLRWHQLATRARGMFNDWRATTEELQNQRAAMLQTAQAMAARGLKRDAFEQWRLALEDERQIRETEKFYQSLEAKATKARDLFLLSKAFTHWAQCASEQVLRKTAARKHILKAKYFNAWRDISVVNVLKVRRQGLTKFLHTWTGRTSYLFRLEDQATDFRVAHSTAQAYRSWFWHFCDRRAPAWYTLKLQRALLAKWREATRAARIRRQWSIDFRNLELSRQGLVRWTQRSNAVQDSIFQAANFRHQRLLGPTVEALQRELHFAPLHEQCLQLVDTRIVRIALARWIKQTRAILQARRVDDLRISRNAWTTWNDGLRCRTLSRSINDRIVLQALYKWVLAERLALCERVQLERLVSSIFGRWRTKGNRLAAALGKARHLAKLAQDRRTKASIIVRWTSVATVAGQEEERAQHFRDRNLSSRALRSWISIHRHNVKIDKWAQDARFYIVATKSVKQWREKAVATKKDKRKSAYMTVRRRVKMALARDVLQTWRERASEKLALIQVANEACKERILTTMLELHNYWRGRTTAIRETALQANTLYSAHLVQSHLRVLLYRYREVQDLVVNASAFRSESVADSASTCIRKFNWQLFQVKRLHESAESLQERNKRRHFKNMLRHWADATRSKRRGSATEDANPSDRISATAARAESWTPFPGIVHRRQQSAQPAMPNLLDQVPELGPVPSLSSTMATPAYLRTPSRHRANQRPSRFSYSAQPHLQNRTSASNVSGSDAVQQGSRTVQLPERTQIPFPSTPAPPPTVQPQTQPPLRTQITPFMSRLRTHYGGQAPSSTGMFQRSTRFGGVSALSRDFGASLRGPEEVEEVEEVDEGDGEAEDGVGDDAGRAQPTGGGPGMFDIASELSEDDGGRDET